MGLQRGFKERAGSSFMEYVTILGVVSALLIGMNTYLKRGLQNRIKEMTDYFISPTQLVEINPTLSQTETLSEATIDNEAFLAGGTSERRFETRNIQARSSVEDIEPPFQAPFAPAESGEVTLPPPPQSQPAQGGG